MFRLNKKFKINHRTAFDAITISAIVFGTLALISLVYFYVRPLSLADIKVPVATDKATYYPEQEVSGIFFGETRYSGDVKILREIFCSNYRGVIKPPAESADGDFFSTQARPRKLEGATVRIGTLPANVPIGSNCVIQFTNVYDIQTPFGVRHETVQYYTQNFSIIAKEEKEEREQIQQQQRQQQSSATNGAVSQDGGDSGNTNTNSVPQTSNSNNKPTSPPTTPAEPIQPPQQCTINLLGVKLLCNR